MREIDCGWLETHLDALDTLNYQRQPSQTLDPWYVFPCIKQNTRELPMIMQYYTSSHLRPLSTYSTRPDLGTQK